MAKPKSKVVKNSKLIMPPNTAAISQYGEFKKEQGLMSNAGLNSNLFGQFPFMDSSQLSQVDTLFKNNRWYLVSNMRQLLSELYIELGLIQAVVDIPVDDALRGGIDVHSKQLGEENTLLLMNQVEEDDDLTTIGETAKWTRLFGGGGTLIMTEQDPATPLDLAAIGPGQKLGFRSADLWELFWDLQNTEGYNPAIGQEDFEWYSYYGTKIHKTRVMKMKGLKAPSFVRPRLRGWGFSVIEAMVRSINQYLKSADLSFEVMDEFKVDYYKIKNLTTTMLGPQGQAKVRARIQEMNSTKNYLHAVAMDSEDAWEQKQLSWAGLSEAQQGIRMQVASDMRMPMIKLFGTPATGLGADDEESLEVYNSMVESQVRGKIKYDIIRMLKVKCQHMFGSIPEDLSMKFKPLRVLSATQEEEVKTSKFNRVQQAKTAGEITVKEYREAVNKGNLLDIQLDTDDQTLDAIESDQEADAALGAGVDPSGKKDTNGDANEGEDPSLVNSLEYERAAFEADGGAQAIDIRHKLQLEQITDDDLYGKAWQMAAPENQWQFVYWYYVRHGGKFN